jgi:hypothetical protein
MCRTITSLFGFKGFEDRSQSWVGRALTSPSAPSHHHLIERKKLIPEARTLLYHTTRTHNFLFSISSARILCRNRNDDRGTFEVFDRSIDICRPCWPALLFRPQPAIPMENETTLFDSTFRCICALSIISCRSSSCFHEQSRSRQALANS